MRELPPPHFKPNLDFPYDRQGQFRYTQGAPVGFFSTPGLVERTHCGRCGSPISYETKGEFALYACTLDDPTQVKPTYHVLTVEQLPWLEIADDLPRYEYGSREEAPVSYGPRGRS